MIPKLNSNELNNMLLDSKNNFENSIQEFNNLKDDIIIKEKIIEHELEYMTSLIEGYNDNSELTGYRTFLLNNCLRDSKCEIYGANVHQKFLDDYSINVFNLKTVASPEYYFRNDVYVKINDTTQEEYTDILKHDSLKKKIFFEEFDDNNITISICLPELSKQLGPTTFNCIEFDSYLKGSFDIESINVYNTTNNYTNILNNESIIQKAGKFRLVLSERYNFNRIDINIKLNYCTDNNKYIFGIKHIYLYNADFKQYTIDNKGNKDIASYAIYKVDLPNGVNLNTINNRIRINTLTGSYEKDATENGIKFYIDYGGEYENELETSKIEENTFPGNFNSFYVKVPLCTIGANNKVINENIVSIGIKYTTR